MLLFVSCAYNKVYINGVYSHRGSRNNYLTLKTYYDDTTCFLFDSTETIPDGSKFIENIQLKRNLWNDLPLLSSVIATIDELKTQAKKIGANIIKIVSVQPIKKFPYGGYLAIAKFYKLEGANLALYKKMIAAKTLQSKNTSIIYLKNYWWNIGGVIPVEIYFNDTLIATTHSAKKIKKVFINDFVQFKITNNGVLSRVFADKKDSVLTRRIDKLGGTNFETGHVYYIYIGGRYNPSLQFCTKYDF